MKTVTSVVVVALMAASAASGYVRVYAIDPVRADWSGEVDPEDGVRQSVVCNFDGLEGCFAEYFTGTATNGDYVVEVLIPGRTPELVVADGRAAEPRSHVWVRCSLSVQYPESIVKGRTYEVKWTLSGGSESLAYYYQGGNPYPWGSLRKGGTDEPDCRNVT